MARELIKKAFSGLAGVVNAARSDVDEIRDRISDLQAQIKRVKQLPEDLETVGAKIDVAMKRAVDEFPFAYTSSRMTVAEWVNANTLKYPFAVFATLQPETLKAALMAGLPEGISSDERQAKLSALARDLEAGEIAEEVICREIDRATNTFFPRRTDANPAILLAPDEELEPDADR